MGAVGEHDRRDDVVAVVPLLDGPRAVGVDLDVVPLERDALVAEEPLGTTAVGTPARAIDADRVVHRPLPSGQGRTKGRTSCHMRRAAARPGGAHYARAERRPARPVD